jgi:hypothetical protein
MQYNVMPILELINKKEESIWEQEKSRVDLFQYNHYMELYHILKVDEENFLLNKEFVLECYKDQEIFKYAKIITNEFEKKYNKKVVKMYLIRFMPQHYPIRQYYSIEEYEESVTTCFFPIVVNDNSQVSIEANTYSPKPGDVYIKEPESLGAIYNFGNTKDIYLFAQFL